PIAARPRPWPPGRRNTPSGRFWIGKSAWPLAEATQLRRPGACVSSIMTGPNADIAARFATDTAVSMAANTAAIKRPDRDAAAARVLRQNDCCARFGAAEEEQ